PRVAPMRALLLPIAAALLSHDAAATLQREELSSSHAFSIVRSLCDEVGPRLAGSPGDRAAVAWALRTMPTLGLSNVHAEKVMVTHWERGEARAELLGTPDQSLAVAALGGSVGTGPRGVEAEVVEAASLEELDRLGAAAVKGKIVFLDPIMRRARDGAGYGEVVRNRHFGAREAAKLGAVAMLLRSAGTDHDRLPHTGGKSKDDHEIPAAALSVPDAELLHRVLEERRSARVRLLLGCRSLPEVPSANVVGDVPGREKPGEVVVVGAHLDSWDLGSGAIDDGAGVAIALETGRLLAAMPQKPRRTVRVVLFANEEHGIQGAREYARAHAAELGTYVAALEADFGADAVYAVRWMGDPAARERFDELARLLAPMGIAAQDSPGEAGADIGPLLAAGVPVLDLRQDGTRYFDVHHTASDTLDKIDPGVLAQAAASFATAAWAAADLEGDLGRVPEAMRKERW
ncbi:MAG: M20/M25/M40 family metallo-hydrolase, partial [Polyangiaceae bacterium]